MNDLFIDAATLTAKGRQFLINFHAALKNVMSADAILDMSEAEIKTLGDILIYSITNAVDKQINIKQQNANEFNAMTDEEFEKYLQEKYSSMWQFCTLTTEELARVPVLTSGKIKELLKDGVKHTTHIPQSGVRIPSGSIWDPKPGRRYK